MRCSNCLSNLIGDALEIQFSPDTTGDNHSTHESIVEVGQLDLDSVHSVLLLHALTSQNP